MVKNHTVIKAFEIRLLRKSKPNFHENLRIANELLRYAITMKIFPPKNRLEDIEIDIRFAKAINSVR